MPNPVTDPAVSALMGQIRELSARIQQLERNQRSSYNMANTSIDANNLVVNDDQGNPAVLLGLLPDGTYGVSGVGQAVPTVAPDPPVVLPQLNALMVVWDGLMGGGQPPQNFAMVQVHCSADPNFTPSTATLAGSIPSAGSYTVNGLTAGTTYYVALVGVNQQGNTGPASATASGVPVAVAQLITAQQITTQMLAANMIYAGIVNGTLITGAQLAVDALSGEILVYDGPMSNGNLIGSWSGAAGTDQFNNPFPAGLNVSVGSISGTIFSGLNWVLNNNGLFFYGAGAPIVLAQTPSGSGNLNFVSATSPATISVGPISPTARGSTVIFVIATYTSGIFTTGVNWAKMQQSGAAMTRIAHVPFNSTSGSGPTMGAVGWLDVWASYNTPGGDSGVTFNMPMATNSPNMLAYSRQIFEFSGMGTSPSIDVYTPGYNTAGTGTAFNSGSAPTSSPTELWIGGVAGYYNPSGTPPTITGPAGPWTNQAQLGGQIDAFSSSISMMTGYQIMGATGSAQYAGTFSAAENWGAFALAIQPSVAPGGLGSLALALSAVSGADANGNQFPVGYMGKTTAIQPGSSPVLPEGWHSLGTMPSGLTGVGRYKLIAEANCILLDILVNAPSGTTAQTWSLPSLPAAYNVSAPGGMSRIYTMQGNAAMAAVGQNARLFISGTSIQVIFPATSNTNWVAGWTGVLPLN